MMKMIIQKDKLCPCVSNFTVNLLNVSFQDALVSKGDIGGCPTLGDYVVFIYVSFYKSVPFFPSVSKEDGFLQAW